MVSKGPAAGVAAAQLGAGFAWRCHPGWFRSPMLEGVLRNAGQGLTAEGSETPRRRRERPETVLHVLTTAHEIGGHTRLVWNWIEADQGRRHSVFLTRSQGPIPPLLSGAVERAGGRIVTAAGSLTERVLALRREALRCDCVVLHVDPSDPFPSLAFAVRGGLPPIVLLNHADHVFGLDGGCDLVACLREGGRSLAVQRRGFALDRTALLPIPLALPERNLERERAKQLLGIEAGCTVLLSVASSYKYTTVGGLSFPQLHVPLLTARPNTRFLVVGPRSEGPWKDAEQQTGGRLQALGRQKEVALHYQCADIYVDSFPLGSLTSLLEAVSYGTPAVTYAPHYGSSPVLCADDPSVGDDHFSTDPEAYGRNLLSLVDLPDVRRANGAQAAVSVRSTHGGRGWLAHLERVYSLAAEAVGRAQDDSPRRYDDELLDVLLTVVQGRRGAWNAYRKSKEDVSELFGGDRFAWAGPGLLGRLAADWVLRAARSVGRG